MYLHSYVDVHNILPQKRNFLKHTSEWGGKEERQPESVLQTKEQGKNQQDQMNEEETGKTPEKEFREQ